VQQTQVPLLAVHNSSLHLQHHSIKPFASSHFHTTSFITLSHLAGAMSSQYYTYSTASAPINMPYKGYPAYPSYQHGAYSRVSASPPEAPESVTTGSGITSYDPSAASSSYAGSASEYDTSSTGTSSVDLLEYMNDRLAGSYNPMPLDRSLAQQSQA
jgi:hypothetical protein